MTIDSGALKSIVEHRSAIILLDHAIHETSFTVSYITTKDTPNHNITTFALLNLVQISIVCQYSLQLPVTVCGTSNGDVDSGDLHVNQGIEYHLW